MLQAQAARWVEFVKHPDCISLGGPSCREKEPVGIGPTVEVGIGDASHNVLVALPSWVALVDSSAIAHAIRTTIDRFDLLCSSVGWHRRRRFPMINMPNANGARNGRSYDNNHDYYDDRE